MRARIILRSIGHKCFPKKKKRSSPVVSKRAADGRQKSHMRLRSRGLPTYGLGTQGSNKEDRYFSLQSYCSLRIEGNRFQKTTSLLLLVEDLCHYLLKRNLEHYFLF